MGVRGVDVHPENLPTSDIISFTLASQAGFLCGIPLIFLVSDISLIYIDLPSWCSPLRLMEVALTNESADFRSSVSGGTSRPECKV